MKLGPEICTDKCVCVCVCVCVLDSDPRLRSRIQSDGIGGSGDCPEEFRVEFFKDPADGIRRCVPVMILMGSVSIRSEDPSEVMVNCRGSP